MTESINEEYVKKMLDVVTLDFGLENWSYKQQSFANVAQNYFGEIIPISLNGYVKGKEITLNLVLKLAPTDERYRVSGALTLFFAREIFVYSTILPKYQEIQNNLSLESKFIVPKCFYINSDYCNEAIIMQNMCADDYHPFTRDKYLTLEHMMLSVNCLAQFHALSFILHHQETDIYESAVKVCVPLNRETNRRFIDILKDRLIKGSHTFVNTQYESLFQYFHNECESYVERMYKSANNTCLCHGDIWKENLLFKYKDDQPISVCMIDYQTTRISSPAFDVLYLILSSTTAELRSKYFKKLLNTYYHALEKILQQSNLNASEIYSRKMFDDDLKVVGPGCFMIANTAIWLSSGLQQEGHVRSKIILYTEAEKEAAVEQYKNRIKDIIDDLKNYGFI